MESKGRKRDKRSVRDHSAHSVPTEAGMHDVQGSRPDA